MGKLKKIVRISFGTNLFLMGIILLVIPIIDEFEEGLRTPCG
jgi:hypothetical protein